ncbi:MAG: TIGR04211 family SH3 domain-containing protein [Gammaproteobacteria bacterium]
MTISNRNIFGLVCTLWSLALAVPAVAQTTRYITDEFQVPVREAPKQDSRIVTLIASGTPVEVLQKGFRGFTLIRAQGSEGWVRTQDLMNVPSGRARLAAAEQRFEQQQAALQQSRQDAEAMQKNIEDLERENERVARANRRLDEALSALRERTARPLATQADNRRLQAALRTERETVRQLMDQNDALQVQALRDWFVTGVAVSLGSLLLGVVIARIPWRRHRSWGTS